MKRIQFLLPVLLSILLMASACNSSGNETDTSTSDTTKKDTTSSDPESFSQPH